MHTLSYPAKLSPESKGAFTVMFPDLPEAITCGANLDDAVHQAADCLACALGGRMADGMEIPRPSRSGRNQRLIQVPLYLALKVALYMAMRESKVNSSQLARKLGVSETVVRRMLNPRRHSKPERMEAALEALGKRIQLMVEDAA